MGIITLTIILLLRDLTRKCVHGDIFYLKFVVTSLSVIFFGYILCEWKKKNSGENSEKGGRGGKLLIMQS